MPDDAAKRVPEPMSLERDAPSERFIRTFASDSAAVKSGAKPDFMQTQAAPAPAKTTPEDALANAASFSSSDTIDLDKSPAERQPSVSMPTPAVSGPAPSIPALSTDMMPIEGAAAKAAAPLAATAPMPASAAPLHTYTSDFADKVEKTHATPASILAAEQDAAVHRTPEKRALNISLIAGAVVLLLLGGGGAYYAYRISSMPTTVAVMQLTPARIFVDDRQELSGTGAALEAAIEQSEQKALASGAIRLIYTSTGTSTGQSIFQALQFAAPDILLRNISAPGSMAGIANVSGTQSPFFLLAVESYTDTFAGMLQWEPTMAQATRAIFPLYHMGSSTPSALPVFKDEVIANHDTRVLRDTESNTLVIYGYWDQRTLLIARNEAAFIELLGRLANSRTAQ